MQFKFFLGVSLLSVIQRQGKKCLDRNFSITVQYFHYKFRQACKVVGDVHLNRLLLSFNCSFCFFNKQIMVKCLVMLRFLSSEALPACAPSSTS